MSLTWPARAFGAAFVIHALDHLIRGFDASPTFVMAVGFVQGAFVLLAVALVLARAPQAAAVAVVVGLASAFLVTYGHLLPGTSQTFADSFATQPNTHVTWFSWTTGVAEAVTAIAFAAAGALALRPRITA